MNENIVRLLLASFLLTGCLSAFAQEKNLNPKKAEYVMDSLKKSGIILSGSITKPEIVLSNSQAIKFLQQQYQSQHWNDVHHPLRLAMGRLIYEASQPPFDSSKYYLKEYHFDSIRIPWDKFYIWEPLKIKIAETLRDTSVMVVLDTLKEVTSENRASPFRYFNYPFQADSLEVAVRSLVKYLEDRDSSVIFFGGTGSVVTPLWINSKMGSVERFWLKNDLSDSVTVWIGNHSRDTIGLYLEKGVSFRRPMRQENYSEAKINIKALDNSKLLTAKEIYIKPQYWKYRTEASCLFSQTALSNWVKGGENSISTSLDIMGYATYVNKQKNLSSNNFVRLKLGFMKSESDPVRKNLDLFETSSKLNHKAFGKFDFSAILLFKTQFAPGYNYTTETSVMVSKFLNPAIITVGFGLDYKPNKTTSINFSPLSYKGTFVTDTAHIDQTKYGIPNNKKSTNEPGLNFIITNEYRPVKNMSIINRLQLFTNYIHNPQNIDVDWEMIATWNLNWFTDIRLNTHLIYDDDTRTVVLDNDKQPVLNPDGTPKITARVQFKELLGLSFVFRF